MSCLLCATMCTDNEDGMDFGYTLLLQNIRCCNISYEKWTYNSNHHHSALRLRTHSTAHSLFPSRDDQRYNSFPLGFFLSLWTLPVCRRTVISFDSRRRLGGLNGLRGFRGLGGLEQFQ